MIGRLLPLIGTGSLMVTVALLGQKAAETYQGQRAFVAETTMPTNKAPTNTLAPTQVAQRPVVYYAAITDRPLFEPTRRPFMREEAVPEFTAEPVDEAPAPAAPTELPPPELTLQGVMTMDNNTVALIGINGDIPAWVSKGDTVSGWSLSKIGSDWVEISREARRIRVEMYK